MNRTIRTFIGLFILAILIAGFILFVCVYNIKPEFFKYKLNTSMTELKRTNTTLVSIGNMDSKTTLAKIGERYSLLLGRKLEVTENFDVHAVKGRPKRELVAVRFKNGSTMLFASPNLIENPPQMPDEFYEKANIGEIKLHQATLEELMNTPNAWENSDTILINGAAVVAIMWSGAIILGL